MQYRAQAGETFDDIAAKYTISPAYGNAIVRANGFQYTDGTDVDSFEDASAFDVITIPDNWLNSGARQAQATGGASGAVVDSGLFNQILDAAPRILAAFNAQQIAQINIDRAQRGLPAINAAAYGPQIGIGLNPGMSQMLMYGALGIGAIMLLNRPKRR